MKQVPHQTLQTQFLLDSSSVDPFCQQILPQLVLDSSQSSPTLLAQASFIFLHSGRIARSGTSSKTFLCTFQLKNISKHIGKSIFIQGCVCERSKNKCSIHTFSFFLNCKWKWERERPELRINQMDWKSPYSPISGLS